MQIFGIGIGYKNQYRSITANITYQLLEVPVDKKITSLSTP